MSRPLTLAIPGSEPQGTLFMLEYARISTHNHKISARITGMTGSTHDDSNYKDAIGEWSTHRQYIDEDSIEVQLGELQSQRDFLQIQRDIDIPEVCCKHC